MFDLHESRMNVSVVNLAPAVILDKNDDTKAEGVEARLMLEVARKFNMEPHFAMPRDGEWWGWINPKATGVVGEVTKRNIYQIISPHYWVTGPFAVQWLWVRHSCHN